MKKVSLTRICKRRGAHSDFNTLGNELFLCQRGLSNHWNTDRAKKLEITLHNGTPSAHAHRFFAHGPFHSGISIRPEAGEDWDEKTYGTYNLFGAMLRRYATQAGSREGWMEIQILE